MAWNGTVTNVGLVLLQNWMTAGSTLTIDGAKTGTGTVPLAQLMGQTDVAGTVHSVSVINSTSVADGVKFDVSIPAASSAYTAMQIGIFAHIGTGNSTLLALFQADSEGGINVPSSSQMVDFNVIFAALVQMYTDGDLEVTIDPTALVNQGQMSAALAALKSSYDAALAKIGLAVYEDQFCIQPYEGDSEEE